MSSNHGTSHLPKQVEEKKEILGRDKDTVFFGLTNFRNQEKMFGIKRPDRRQHMYVIGKTGTGKTALLNNLAMQDIANGDGVCIVDPHGEFVEGMLEKIPPHRIKDVIYVNPADTDYHIGFNVLELPDPKYKHLVASGLMGIFTKMWANVWSARMEYILNNAILALLDTPDSTLLGIPRLLVDKDFRQKIVNNIKDMVVKAFWIHEYESWKEQFRNEAIAPIQNKVGQFLSTEIIRNIVGQKKSTINIFDLMNQQKILLINVSKGRIGEDNAALLGAMFITQIQLSAMERVRIPESERKDFFLYVDEFQNFATDSFANILSEARKYRLDLVLAHQYTGQLVTDNSTKVRDAVFGNVGTMIIFRVGAADAELLEQELTPEFMATDVVKLPNYSIYVKLMINGITSRPFSARTIPPIEVKHPPETREKIIESSRKLYCRSRTNVERELREWSGISTTPEGGSSRDQHHAGGNAELYPAVCDNCGKNTKLAFKPTPGKPVFCKSCYNKMTAEKAAKAHSDEPKDNTHIPSLSALGIEFIHDNAKGKKDEDKKRGQQKARAKEPNKQTTPLSLGDLETDPGTQKPKWQSKNAKPDVEALRNALKETLRQEEERDEATEAK